MTFGPSEDAGKDGASDEEDDEASEVVSQFCGGGGDDDAPLVAVCGRSRRHKMAALSPEWCSVSIPRDIEWPPTGGDSDANDKMDFAVMFGAGLGFVVAVVAVVVAVVDGDADDEERSVDDGTEDEGAEDDKDIFAAPSGSRLWSEFFRASVGETRARTHTHTKKKNFFYAASAPPLGHHAYSSGRGPRCRPRRMPSARTE